MNFIAGARNTGDLLRDKAVLLVDRLEAAVTGDLAPARTEAEFMARMIGERLQGGGELRDYLEPLLLGALAASSQVDAVQFVSADRYQEVAFRDPTGKAQFRSRYLGDDQLLFRALDTARQNSRSYWWKPEFVARGDDTYITAHAPVWVRGQFRGVVIVAVSMASISQLASDLSARQGMTAFVFSGDRVLGHYLLAGNNRPISEASPVPTRDELGDEVIAKYDSATEIDVFRGRMPESIAVRFIPNARGEDWVMITKPLTAFPGLDLTIGTYMQRRMLDFELDRMWRSGLAGLAAMLVSVLLAILAGRKLAQPIRELAAGAMQVGELDFDKVARIPRSSIREIDEQARSFNTMIDALRWFERYVPKSLVRRLVSEGETEIDSESRTATVLFTDIAGYTRLTEGFTPSATAALLNRHFGLLAACIEKHGGLVDKYMGDGMMAFWLADDGNGDETARAAAAAALAMAQAIERDNAQRVSAGDPPFEVRVGIHTGPVIVGNIGSPGRINYTVVGVTVNIAQRLEQFARNYRVEGRPVTILASGETARYLPGAMVDSLGRHRVRGITGPMEIVRLVQRESITA